MDKIYIKNLEVFANHGVFPEETALGQKFLLSAVLYTDTRKAGLTDDLSASIHYGEVSMMMKNFAEQHTFKLLESLAEGLALKMLTEVPNLHQVKLEIQKPWAPVKLPLETVSVEITRGWHTAYIALGSNMGNKEAYLKQAVKALEAAEGCRTGAVSDFIITEPYGYTQQDKFLNACMELHTLLTPEELLELLHRIEADAGRKRKIRWGPRTLDLDIILYDDRVVDSRELQIPHAEMHKRDFVLRPLAQISPFLRHPILKKTVAELLEDVEKQQHQEEGK